MDRSTTTAALLAALYCLRILYGAQARPRTWGAVLGLAGIPVYLWCTRTQRRAAILGSEPT